MTTSEMTITAREAAAAAALSAAADYGETAGAAVTWTATAVAGVQVDMADGRTMFAEVWVDDDEFAWVTNFETVRR